MKLQSLITALIFLTTAHAQNVGIGTSTPQARLHVTDSAVLFAGPVTIPVTTTYYPPASGAGTRMMWYPQKAAFRVGFVDGDQWDKDHIGRSSFATGYNTKASGEYSTSMGYNTTASGLASISMGYNTTASGFVSTSMGFGTMASGGNSTSMGLNTLASEASATSMGYYTTASGNSSTSMGYNTTASGLASTSMGYNTTASGFASTGMGTGTTAKAFSGLSIGSYNDNSDTPDPGIENPADRLFQIGNGTLGARNNVLTVLRNGNMGIGTVTPTSLLNVNGQVTIEQKNFGGYGGLLIKGNIPGSNYPNIAFSVKNTANIDVPAAMIQGDLQNASVNTESIDLTFSTAQAGFGSLSEKLRIKGNGNVGIGTNNPIRPLSFPAALGEKILLFPAGGGEVGIGVYNNELRIHTDYAAARISFGYQDNAGNFTQTMWLNNTTSVLTVAGTAYPSDERFKKQITAIQNPLQKLMNLNGVEYYMRKEEFPEMNFSDTRQTGLIAQEVEKVMPSAVYEINDKGYKGVDYAKLVPLLIESIKEQNKKMEEQQKQIDEQRKMIEELLKK